MIEILKYTGLLILFCYLILGVVLRVAPDLIALITGLSMWGPEYEEYMSCKAYRLSSNPFVRYVGQAMDFAESVFMESIKLLPKLILLFAWCFLVWVIYVIQST